MRSPADSLCRTAYRCTLHFNYQLNLLIWECGLEHDQCVATYYHNHLPSSVATRFQVKELFLRLDVINNVENANSTVNTPKHVHHQSLVPAVSHFLPYFCQ